MQDDDDTQPQPMPTESDPIQRLYVGISEMQFAYANLAIALDADDRDGIERSAHELVVVALGVGSLVAVLPTPNAEAVRDLAIAQRALSAGIEVVDELFALAIARDSSVSELVRRVRGEVAVALGVGKPPVDRENVC